MAHRQQMPAHFECHHRQAEDEADDEAPLHVGIFGDGPSPSVGVIGSSAMPQIGQLPGPGRWTSGCIGQVQIAPSGAGFVTRGASPIYALDRR
jgi:hypothetical protein